jgi:hypothetical protein
MDKMTPSVWMTLPIHIRKHFIKVFEIGISGSTSVALGGMNESKILSDGRTENDLAHVTSEKLAEYVNDNASTGFFRLLQIAISKAEGELNPMPVEIKTQAKEPELKDNAGVIETNKIAPKKDVKGKK